MARCIYRCRRKTCGAVGNRLPGERNRAGLAFATEYGPRYYRIEGTDRRYLGSEHKCQACGTTEARADQIKGSFSNHPCDERCTSARGHVCECKCGGKNHGAGWLQCTAGTARHSQPQRKNSQAAPWPPKAIAGLPHSPACFNEARRAPMPERQTVTIGTYLAARATLVEKAICYRQWARSEPALAQHYLAHLKKTQRQLAALRAAKRIPCPASLPF